MKAPSWRSRAGRAAAIACGLLCAAGAAALGLGLALAAGAAAAADAPVKPVLLTQVPHARCPLAGMDDRALLIGSAAQWRTLVDMGEQGALGRGVRWRDQRVLVVALRRQPTLGVSLSLSEPSPWRGGLAIPPRLRLHVARPGEGEVAQAALSRPCVIAVLARAPWREIWVDSDDRSWRLGLPGGRVSAPRRAVP